MRCERRFDRDRRRHEDARADFGSPKSVLAPPDPIRLVVAEGGTLTSRGMIALSVLCDAFSPLRTWFWPTTSTQEAEAAEMMKW